MEFTSNSELRRNRKRKIASAESSSSTSLVKGNKKDLIMYFAVTYNNKFVDETNPFECYDWYALNPNVSPVEQYSTLSPITRMLTPVRHGGQLSPECISTISLDSKLYVFKSYSTLDYVKTYLSLFDTSTGDWADVLLPKKLKMISPKLVTCGRMIYILEENRARRDSNVWGEAFDPATNSLTPLPKPPGLYSDDDYELDCSAVIDDTRFFIRFKFKNEMLVFDINLWSWSSVEVPYVSCGDDLKLVVSSGIVYFFCGLEIFVYDLAQGGGICDKVRGLVLPSSVGGVSCPFFPFHRGKNHFYLIWTPWRHYRASEGRSVIHSLKFKVDRVTDYRGRQTWQATVDCCDSYLVRGSDICDCVAIEGNKKWNMESCGGVKIAP